MHNEIVQGRKIALFIFGLPGSGKSTLTTALDTYGFRAIGIGALLRELIATTQNEAEKQVAQEVIERGSSTPLYLVRKLIEYEFKRGIPNRVVFDNYPRDTAQLDDLDDLLSPWGFRDENRFAILLDVDEELLRERIRQRQLCDNCKSVAVSDEEFCRSCGKPLARRSDDHDKIVDKKIQWYKEHVVPIIAQFERNKRLLVFPAASPTQKIVEAITKTLTSQ